MSLLDREQGFIGRGIREPPSNLPAVADVQLLRELLESQRRTEGHLAAIAQRMSSGQPAQLVPKLDRETANLFGLEGTLADRLPTSLFASVICAGRVSTSPRGIVSAAASFILQDDTKEFNEEVVGKTILITSGPGVGERRVICALGERNNQVRVLRRFRSVPDGNSTYVILDSSTYGSMFESSRQWLATSAAVVNSSAANGSTPRFINLTARGVIVHANFANMTGVGSWSVRIEVLNFLNTISEIFRAQVDIDTAGDYYYYLHPYPTSPNYRGWDESIQGILPIGSWQVRVSPVDTPTADIYVDAQYLQ